MIVVIYHKADFDGIFCREIARKKFEHHAEYIGWDYGDPVPDVPNSAKLYMLDISVPELMNHPDLTWVDHHKTAIEKYGSRKGIQLDGVAACRLTWHLFFSRGGRTKEDYLDRKVDEPLAVRLAGEYDIWDKRDSRADTFQFGLRSLELGDKWWDQLLTTGQFGEPPVNELLQRGALIQNYQIAQNAKAIKGSGFALDFEGYTFLAINQPKGYNSLLFTAGLTEGHDACLGFGWDGSKWIVSLYGAPHRPDIDLSVIAKKYGGGGHMQACGFQVDELPFRLVKSKV